MNKLVKIIAEQAGDHWSVWFADMPQVAFGGEMPTAAAVCVVSLFIFFAYATVISLDECPAID